MASAEWESYVLSGRFKTKRRRNRDRKKQEKKQLLKTYRELQHVRRKQHELPLIELNPPIQKGWKRCFVLRPDLANNKDTAFFLELLEKINTETYSHRKDFKHKRRRRGKKVYVDKVQNLQEFYGYENSFRNMSERELTFFRMETEFIGRSTRTRIKYVFTDPWRFVLRVRPNMITHVHRIDPGLKSREKEIRNYLERNHLYEKLWRLLDGSSYQGGWRTKKSLRCALKSDLRKTLETINKNTNE